MPPSTQGRTLNANELSVLIDLAANRDHVSASRIASDVGISRFAAVRALTHLVDSEFAEHTGTVGRVYYSITEPGRETLSVLAMKIQLALVKGTHF